MSLTATASGNLATWIPGHYQLWPITAANRRSSVQNRGHAKHAGGRLNYALATGNWQLAARNLQPASPLRTFSSANQPSLIHRAAIFSTFSQVAMLPPIILCFINDSAAKTLQTSAS